MYMVNVLNVQFWRFKNRSYLWKNGLYTDKEETADINILSINF